MGIFWSYAVVKMIILFVWFFWFYSIINNIFAADPIELNSSNILSLWCPIDAKQCELSSKNIGSIATDTFINHPNLADIFLNDNQITSIEYGDFAGLSNLISLTLNNNQLTEIDFSWLINIQKWNISYNNLPSTWIENNLIFLQDHNIVYLPQNEISISADKQWNFSIVWALINDWPIYDETLISFHIISTYQGDNYWNAIWHVWVPIGFNFETIPFSENIRSEFSGTVYGWPWDWCYADFIEWTWSYIPHINTLVDNLIAESIDCTEDPEIDCTITIDEENWPVSLKHSEEIYLNSGMIAYNRALVDVFALMWQEKWQESLLEISSLMEDMLIDGVSPSSIISQMCAYVWEYDLNQCMILWQNFDHDLWLSAVDWCGATVYYTTWEIMIESDNNYENWFVWRNPYIVEWLDINLFVSSEDTIDSNISDNMSRIHIDMEPWVGLNCINSGNTMETIYGDIETIYIDSEGSCEKYMWICIAWDMNRIDTSNSVEFIPVEDNDYYDDATCTNPIRIKAENVFISGTPKINSIINSDFDYPWWQAWEIDFVTQIETNTNTFEFTSTNDGIPYLSSVTDGYIYIKEYKNWERSNISTGLINDFWLDKDSSYTLGIINGDTPYILTKNTLSLLNLTNGEWTTLVDNIEYVWNEIWWQYLFTNDSLRKLSNWELNELSLPNISCEIEKLDSSDPGKEWIEIFATYMCNNDTKEFWSLADNGQWIQIGGIYIVDNWNIRIDTIDSNNIFWWWIYTYSKQNIVEIYMNNLDIDWNWYETINYFYFINNKWISLPEIPDTTLVKNDILYFIIDNKFYTYDWKDDIVLEEQYNNFSPLDIDSGLKYFSDENWDFYIQTINDKDINANDRGNLFKFIDWEWSKIIDFTSLYDEYNIDESQDNASAIIPVPGTYGIQLDGNGLPLIWCVKLELAEDDNWSNTIIADIYQWSGSNDWHFVKRLDMIGKDSDIDSAINAVKDIMWIEDEITTGDIRDLLQTVLVDSDLNINIALAPYVINIDLEDGITTYNGNIENIVSFNDTLHLDNWISAEIDSNLPFVLSYQQGNIKVRNFNNNTWEVFFEETVNLENEDIRARFPILFQNDAIIITHDKQNENISIKWYKNNTRSTLIDFGKRVPSVDTLISMFEDLSEVINNINNDDKVEEKKTDSKTDTKTTKLKLWDYLPGIFSYKERIYWIINELGLANFGNWIWNVSNNWLDLGAGSLWSRMDSDSTIHILSLVNNKISTDIITYSIQDILKNINFHYQWYSDNQVINWENNSTYKIRPIDSGKEIYLAVTLEDSMWIFWEPVKSNILLIEKDVVASTWHSSSWLPWLKRDTCPNGDYSPSYYDNDCWDIPTDNETTNDWTTNCTSEWSRYNLETNNAFTYACQLGMTDNTVIQDANIDEYILRKEAAKMISIFATKELKKTPSVNTWCIFSDISNESRDFQDYIQLSCELWIMWLKKDGTPDSIFNPNKYVTRAQFGTMLSRLLYGDSYNIDLWSAIPFYQEHLEILQKNNIMTKINNPITKVEIKSWIMLMMYRISQQ